MEGPSKARKVSVSKTLRERKVTSSVLRSLKLKQEHKKPDVDNELIPLFKKLRVSHANSAPEAPISPKKKTMLHTESAPILEIGPKNMETSHSISKSIPKDIKHEMIQRLMDYLKFAPIGGLVVADRKSPPFIRHCFNTLIQKYNLGSDVGFLFKDKDVFFQVLNRTIKAINNGVSRIIIPYLLIFDNESDISHQNILVIDTKKRTLYHFEPHGQKMISDKDVNGYRLPSAFFRIIQESVKPQKRWRFLTSFDTCPVEYGIQAGDKEGRCAFISLFLTDFFLQYPQYSPRKIYNTFLYWNADNSIKFKCIDGYFQKEFIEKDALTPNEINDLFFGPSRPPDV